MDNLGVARILREIADLLEIKNDNPFKIRAYRNGADIVSNHPHELWALDETGLREIPGIGKDLAGRIREIAQTGDAEYHRELVAEFPPTILDLLHLQGVGPKTVATLYPANVAYRFFVALPDGHHEFRSNLRAHEVAKAEARHAWDSLTAVLRADSVRAAAARRASASPTRP